MSSHRKSVGLVVVAAIMTLAGSSNGLAQSSGKGKGMDADHMKDMQVFHYLLENREHISRTVKKTEKGVETLTESDQPAIAAKIQEHAEAMHKRLKEVRPIHMRDPLFRALFQNASKITMVVEKIKTGVKVTEISDDPLVTRMIQAHADVVSNFIKNGHAEMRKNHSVPEAPETKK